MNKLFSALCTCVLASFLTSVSAQKKQLDEQSYFEWNHIEAEQISNGGRWVSYEINPGYGDGKLALYDQKIGSTVYFDRASNASFDRDELFISFTVKPPKNILDSLERKRVDEDLWPPDTLCILDLNNRSIERIAAISEVQLPIYWSGSVFMTFDNLPVDTSAEKSLNKKPKKDEFTLIHLSFKNNIRDTFLNTTAFELAEKAPIFLVSQRSSDSLVNTLISRVEIKERRRQELPHDSYTIDQIALSETGNICAVIANDDSLNNPSSRNLYYWQIDQNNTPISHSASFDFLPNGWVVSADLKPQFSVNGSHIYFGIKPRMPERDTTLLVDETPVVEVWNYLDKQLYTQQKVNLDKDRKRSYVAVLLPDSNTINLLGDEDNNEIIFSEKRTSKFCLGLNSKPYLTQFSWEGRTYRDIYAIDQTSGEKKIIKRKVGGSPKISPEGHFAWWYEPVDSSYYIYAFAESNLISYPSDEVTIFYDEKNDRPDYPEAYGAAGWIAEDRALLVYDRYDIWQLYPKNSGAKPKRLTQGREKRITHRYIDFDDETASIGSDSIFVHTFDESSQAESYVLIFPQTGSERQLYTGQKLRRNPLKAKYRDHFLFTQESFMNFPDLYLSQSSDFADIDRVSNANPQQSNYKWGTIEVVTWRDFEGVERKGLLAKPEDFDPTKQYPLIVNFYERSSNTLHRHRPPVPGRSTIGYAFYVSNGYVIFNPDVHYKIGYPGESAYNAVVSGTKAMIQKGFIDSTRIGLQGHSWGGYQIADIITRTNMFRCAESGAPVVNMISAYGGIRWGTGLSRMFQYEHTQSRLGATLWDNPQLYLENSPIFRLDKVQTPVLILHNDADTAVPWYQGIEFFVGLRRLGRPAWLLNYNDEPHWPLKWPNRLDFNKRMFQFFNHYLKDKPMPLWMSKGIPAIEKGIENGFEFER